MGRELWSLSGLESRGGDMSKVTDLFFFITSLSMDEFVGDATVEGPDAASRSLLEVVDAAFAVAGACGVSDEFLTVSAYVGGLLLCADSLGLDVGISWSSSVMVGADGVLGPGGVVPGRGGGGGGGGRTGEATL